MRKRCRRKVYQPVDPIQFAIEGCRPISDKEVDKLRMGELTAIQSMSSGSGTINDWSQIVFMLNLCETMANSGVGPEALESCKVAESEMVSAAKRYERTRKMGLTALGLEAIREVFRYHDLQRQSISRAEYERHIQTTANRIRSKAPEVLDVSEV